MPKFEESDGFEEEKKHLEQRKAQRVADAAARDAKLAAIRQATSSESVDFDEDDQLDRQAMEAAEKKVDSIKEARLVQAKAADEAASARRKEPDIIKRARDLFSAGLIDFPDVKKVRSGDMVITQPQMTDENKNTVLDLLFGFDRKKIKERCKADPEEAANLMEGLTSKKPAADELRPHRDMFKGRIVDHTGEVIDDHYPVSAWIETFSAAGLKGMSAKAAREVLKEWSLEHKWNNLIERLNDTIPEWDGKPRMETKLIELFQTHDTPLNRAFGKYFWLSLYGRAMYPGIYAPMVLSLFGAQDCGKSYFGKRLAQIILGNDGSDSVQLNLDGEKIDFLREITGTSIIASVGEMTGFNRGDLNKIKDFITRTSDPMHHKFEGHFDQQRQWITVMDGNSYVGLQRDETGNRRFYPMFCGQLPDEGGQPRWRDDFSAAFESVERGISFTDDVWQLLAEAREWFGENENTGYVTFVREVSRQVAEFSRKEMAAERGIVDDNLVAPYIDQALLNCRKVIVDGNTGKALYIDRLDIMSAIDALAGRSVSASSGFGIGLNKAMKARGGGEKTFRAIKVGVKKTTVPSYRFVGCKSETDLYELLGSRIQTDGEESEVIPAAKVVERDEDGTKVIDPTDPDDQM